LARKCKTAKVHGDDTLRQGTKVPGNESFSGAKRPGNELARGRGQGAKVPGSLNISCTFYYVPR